jgi:hypothetical protein
MPAGFPQVEVSCGIIRVQNDGLTNPFHREVIVAELVSDETEEVKRAGMLWLKREDLAVDRLGIRQPPSLVVFHRESHGLGDRHGERM